MFISVFSSRYFELMMGWVLDVGEGCGVTCLIDVRCWALVDDDGGFSGSNWVNY